MPFQVKAELVWRAVRLWMEIKPVKRIRHKLRSMRNKRRARLGKPLLKVDFSDDKEFPIMLRGSLTYSGVLVALVGVVLGWLGVGECLPADAASGVCVASSDLASRLVAAVDEIVTIVGIVIAARGRARIKQAVYEDGAVKGSAGGRSG